MSTAIPYLDEVWNVTTGCGDDMVSHGCINCYARRMFGRNLWKCPDCEGTGRVHFLDHSAFSGTSPCPTCDGAGHQDFTPTFHADRLDQPLHWRKPRRVGVSFMGDLFHEAITLSQIASVLDIIWRSHEAQRGHTFLMLTKRPERMHSLDFECPPNLHLGVTICNQEEADRNIPVLLDTAAAARWVSLEPMLGAVEIDGGQSRSGGYLLHASNYIGLPAGRPRLDWVVCGPETGPGKRPFSPQWAADVREQCRQAGVPYYDKRDEFSAWRELPVTP